jgi:hypothetical protein
MIITGTDPGFYAREGGGALLGEGSVYRLFPQRDQGSASWGSGGG